MRRWIAFLMALCLPLALFACAEPQREETLSTDPPGVTEEPTTAPTEIPTVPTEPPTEPDPMAAYVDTARTEILKVVNSDGSTTELIYRYPEVLLDGDDGEFWNRQIAFQMDEIIVQARMDVKNGSAYYETMDYSAWLSGDVLVVLMWMQHWGVEYTTYQVGLFDVNTTEELDSGELFCRYTGQRTPTSMLDVLALNLGNWYDEEFQSLEQEEDVAQQREKTLAQANLEKAWLYLDEAGALMAAVPAYTVAGTEMTTAFLELTDFSPIEVSVAPDEDATLEELVAVYRSDELTFTDSDGDYVVSLAIPQVNLNTPSARDCNWELRDSLERFYDDALKCHEEEMFSSLQGISYEAWIWKNILTLMVWDKWSYEYNRYFIYVFDLETGEQMTNDQVATLWGADSVTWQHKLVSASRQTFKDKYHMVAEDDFYFEQMERTMGPENLQASVIYPTPEGKPMAMCRIYAIAGAEYYWHQIQLELP